MPDPFIEQRDLCTDIIGGWRMPEGKTGIQDFLCRDRSWMRQLQVADNPPLQCGNGKRMTEQKQTRITQHSADISDQEAIRFFAGPFFVKGIHPADYVGGGCVLIKDKITHALIEIGISAAFPIKYSQRNIREKNIYLQADRFKI